MNTLSLLTISILFLPFYLNAFPLRESKTSIGFRHELTNLSNIDNKFQTNNNISSSSPISNITTDVSDSLNEKHTKNKRYTLLITFCVVAVFSMLVNIRVFWIVFLTSKRKSRPANILVAHLSSVVILFTILSYTYIMEKSEVFNLSAPGLCNFATLLRSVCYNVLSVNTVAIVWVRVRDDGVILRKSVAYRVIGVIWTITLISNLPSIWMVEYIGSSKNKMGECRKVNLLGSIGATLAYDVLRLVLFNVLVSLYLIRAAIKIRSILRYLQTYKRSHSKIMLKRTKQARLVYFQTILFIVNWLPLGFGVLLYQIFNRSSWKDSYVNYLTPFFILYSNVIILSPLSYVYLVEKMSIGEIIAPCFWAKSKPNLTTIRQDDPEVPKGRPNPKSKQNSNIGSQNKSATLSTRSKNTKKTPNGSFITSEMSRISTCGVTELFPGSEANSMANIRPLPQPVSNHGSSIPARRTLATYVPTKNVSVEVHSIRNESGEIVLHKRNSETLV